MLPSFITAHPVYRALRNFIPRIMCGKGVIIVVRTCWILSEYRATGLSPSHKSILLSSDTVFVPISVLRQTRSYFTPLYIYVPFSYFAASFRNSSDFIIFLTEPNGTSILWPADVTSTVSTIDICVGSVSTKEEPYLVCCVFQSFRLAF